MLQLGLYLLIIKADENNTRLTNNGNNINAAKSCQYIKAPQSTSGSQAAFITILGPIKADMGVSAAKIKPAITSFLLEFFITSLYQDKLFRPAARYVRTAGLTPFS